MTTIHQIPAEQVNSSLRSVAVLHTTLDELARSAGIHPETHNGNLGKQRDVLLEADDGSQYMLVEFCEGPTRDVELRAEERIADPESAIDRFLKSLSLPQEMVVWRVSGADWAQHLEPSPAEYPTRSLASEAPQGETRRLPRTPAVGTTGPPIQDILALLDKLDDLVHNAKPVLLADKVRVDKEKMYDILDQMRATIPEEIKQARWIVKECQESLAEAKREAERIVKEARERQERLIPQHEITKQAERAAEDIVEYARAREREIRFGAEDYADEILYTLEANLSKFIATVQRGRDRLAGKKSQ